MGECGHVCKQTKPLAKEREIRAQIFGLLYASSAAGGTMELTTGYINNAERGLLGAEFSGIYPSKPETVQEEG